MNKKFLVACIFLSTSIIHALPFNVVANGTLPTVVFSNAPTSVSYTITNLTSFNPPSNLIKYLPPNVTVNASGTTCTPSSQFTLAPKQSCILSLTVSGAVNANDPDPTHHLFVCMSDQVSCAGPNFQNSLNVTATTLIYNAVGYIEDINSNTVPISYYSADLGNTWIPSMTPPPPIAATDGTISDELFGVACSYNGSLCTTVGNYSSLTTNFPLSYYTTDNGNHWNLSTTLLAPQGINSALYAVACSHNGLNCTTVGYFNNSTTLLGLSGYSTDGGQNWFISNTQPPQYSTNDALFGVACDTTGQLCTAVGRYETSTTIPLSYISTDGGKNWALSATLPAPQNGNGILDGVSCSSNGLSCVAIGTFFDSFAQYNPLTHYSSDGGNHWALATTLPPKQSRGSLLYAVFCSSNGLQCVAVGNSVTSGNINVPASFVSTDGGKNWALSASQPPLPTAGNGVLYGVTCDPSGLYCAAAGSTSNIPITPISYFSSNGGNSWTTSTTQPITPSGSSSPFMNAVG